jgi:hypothetical protein
VTRPCPRTPPSGAYTIQVSAGATGTALLEITKRGNDHPLDQTFWDRGRPARTALGGRDARGPSEIAHHYRLKWRRRQTGAVVEIYLRGVVHA